MLDATPARTYLFVPGTRPERFAKALASGADAVVLDLEDAVAADDQGRRARRDRDMAAAADRRRRPGAHRGAHQRRRLALVRRRPAALRDAARSQRDAAQGRVGRAGAADTQAAVPDAQRARADRKRTRRGAKCSTWPRPPASPRLVFGTLDFALDLDMDIATDAAGLALCRQPHRDRLARRRPAGAGRRRHAATRRRGAPAGRPGRGRAGMASAPSCASTRARSQPIHAALRPSAQALDWARRVLAADAASPGAARLDGRMVDRPVVLQAQRTLQRAGALNPSPTSTAERDNHHGLHHHRLRASSATSSATRHARRLVRREPHRRSTSTSSAPWPRCRAASASSRRKRPTRSSATAT